MSKSKIVGFWRPTDENGELSQWYSSAFKDSDDYRYVNAEQFMMVQKALLFGDEKIANQMMKVSDPKTLKDLGRQVQNFDEDTWVEHREDIVYWGNYYKFSQNPKLKQFLIDTDDAYLVELSPYDRIWGVGTQSTKSKDWKGLNLLGKALMKVREELSD
jgi:ribA/ribD-fused uncharacterized protein